MSKIGSPKKALGMDWAELAIVAICVILAAITTGSLLSTLLVSVR